jgi:hypothetical protein
MGAKVTITWDGLEQVIGDLSAMEEKAPQNIEAQTKKLADATETVWQQNTPRRTGKLQDADRAETAGMSFTLNNATRYFDWVNDGHETPKGWRTKRGYRLAKRRSHVAGKEMTEKATDFVEQNIEGYLSKFMDNL